MKQYYFEKLDVWQKGRLLVKQVYNATQTFPADEKFGLTQQIRRACISVNCNIVEGSSRQTGKEQDTFPFNSPEPSTQIKHKQSNTQILASSNTHPWILASSNPQQI